MARGRSIGRTGATSGDVLIFLATLSVAVALLYPAWAARSFRARVAQAITDVETLKAAARRVRDQTGRWPSAAAPGEVPPQLSDANPQESIFARDDYRLEWSSWEVVDSVEAVDTGPPPAPDDPPPDTVGPTLAPVVRAIGSIAVHSSDSALLGELLVRYLDENPLVFDTVFLLLLPARGTAPDPR